MTTEKNISSGTVTDRSIPSTAFILAAGYGTRLHPLTHACPKALVPLWGKSMLEHHISMLKKWRVRRIIINTHHLADEIRSFCEAYSDDDIEIILSHEDNILGTGGALRNAAKHLSKNEPFWLLNADIAIDFEPMAFVNHYYEHAPLAVLWVTSARGPRTVEAIDGNISCFRSKQPGKAETYTFCGVHLVDSDVINYLQNKEFCSIISAYDAAIDDGKRVLALECSDAYWADIGTPEQYLKAHQEIEYAYKHTLSGGCLYDPSMTEKYAALQQHNVSIDGFFFPGNDSYIGRNIQVNDTVLWNNVTVNDNLNINHVIAAGPVEIVSSFCGNHTLIVPAEQALTNAEKQAANPFFRDTSYGAEILPARGSDRSYIRLATPSFSCILCRYDAATRKENARHASHTVWLHQEGIPVPQLLYDNPENTFAIYEDAGSIDLQSFIHCHDIYDAKPYYEKLIAHVARLHTRVTKAIECNDIQLEQPFNCDLYHWEHSLFINELVRLRISFTDADETELRYELMQIAAILLQQPPVLIHRDLQSSNVLIRNEDIILIDYQGMRLGAAAYDIASLLYDPYVEIPADMRDHLLHLYNALDTPLIRDEILAAAVIQRLVQALGAYARLGKSNTTARFLQYIPPALTRVKQALSFFPKLTKLEQLTQSLDRC